MTRLPFFELLSPRTDRAHSGDEGDAAGITLVIVTETASGASPGYYGACQQLVRPV